jgi:hypothetical protein
VTTAPHVIPVTDMGILAPVPDRPGVTADTAQLTIVSCLWPNPNDGQRQAVTAALDQNGAHP